MDLKALQKEAHAIAKDHGWWDEDRTFGDLIALVHSELSEALEAYREDGDTDAHWRWHDHDGKEVRRPEGVPFELADVVIRVADMAEWYGKDLAAEVAMMGAPHPDMIAGLTFGGFIAQCHMLVANLYHYSLVSTPSSSPMLMDVAALIIRHIEAMAAHYGIDLDAAIEAKMEYNRTRPYRHGGKAL